MGHSFCFGCSQANCDDPNVGGEPRRYREFSVTRASAALCPKANGRALKARPLRSTGWGEGPFRSSLLVELLDEAIRFVVLARRDREDHALAVLDGVGQVDFVALRHVDQLESGARGVILAGHGQRLRVDV